MIKRFCVHEITHGCCVSSCTSPKKWVNFEDHEKAMNEGKEDIFSVRNWQTVAISHGWISSKLLKSILECYKTGLIESGWHSPDDCNAKTFNPLNQKIIGGGVVDVCDQQYATKDLQKTSVGSGSDNLPPTSSIYSPEGVKAVLKWCEENATEINGKKMIDVYKVFMCFMFGIPNGSEGGEESRNTNETGSVATFGGGSSPPKYSDAYDRVAGSNPATSDNDVCECGHKRRYHTIDSRSQMFGCRGAYCVCIRFTPKEVK